MTIKAAYADLTTIKSELKVTGTGSDAILRNNLEIASRFVDEYCHRWFYVLSAAFVFDVCCGDRLLLPYDLLSVVTLKSDPDSDLDYDDTWAVTDFLLYPRNALLLDQPYDEIVTHPTGVYSFPGGLSAVQITGAWGYKSDVLATTTVNMVGGLSAAATSIVAASGAALSDCQTIKIDDEQIYISSISTNTLTVERGVNGTTAAAHDHGDAISVYRYPAAVEKAAMIHAMKLFKRKDTAYSTTIGAPELGTIEVYQGLDSEVKRLLNPYVRVIVG